MFKKLIVAIAASSMFACAPKQPVVVDENTKYFCLRAPSNCKPDGSPKRPGDVSANEKLKYEKWLAFLAEQERLKSSASTVEIGGQSALIALSDDRKNAFVFGTKPRQGAPLGEIERVVSSAVGCEARLKAGALVFASGFSKSTSMALEEQRGLKLETYCEGDTRDKVKPTPATVLLREEGEVPFPEYPHGNATWLTYSGPHGFQVVYLQEDGRLWLWYPKNTAPVPGAWRVSDKNEACFAYGRSTYNPVTKEAGPSAKCHPRDVDQRTLIAKLDGDALNLASGQLPYFRDKCDAPKEFKFDRERFRCGR